MKTAILFVVSLFLVAPAPSTVQGARGWHGIVPLRTMRREVERVLGKPEKQISKYSAFYRTQTETILVNYARGLPCQKTRRDAETWRVPKNTVESLLITPL